MRCDQFYGLNEWAHVFVSSITEKCIEYTQRVYKDGRTETLEPKELEVCKIKTEILKSECAYGMFDNKYPLYRYTFPDGRVFTEYVQSVIWSSGPMIFTALKDEQGNPVPESLWDENKIEGY